MDQFFASPGFVFVIPAVVFALLILVSKAIDAWIRHCEITTSTTRTRTKTTTNTKVLRISTCARCVGTGEILDQGTWDACPECDGSGEVLS